MLGRVAPVSQPTLFDVDALCSDLIPDDSFYRLLYVLGPQLVSDDDFARMYKSQTHGRPSIPPSILAKVTLLQRHDNVSDREAIRRITYDLGWKYALRVPLGYRGFARTNLVHFRAKLVVHGLQRMPFERLNRLAVELGLLDPESDQVLDSSHIVGAAAVQDTYELLRTGITDVVKALKTVDAVQWGEVLTRLGVDKYEQQQGKAPIDWQEPRARAELLSSLVQDARALVAAVDGTAAAAEPVVQQAAEVLTEILDQDITPPQGDEPPQIKQEVAKDRIISTEDPEMRHGHKSASHRFDGYKVHVAEEPSQEWIANIGVTAGNVHDAVPSHALVTEQVEVTGAHPWRVISDGAYGGGDNRARFAETGIEMISRLANPAAGGCFGKDKFLIDLEAGQVTCPAGQTTEQWRWRRDDKGRPVKTFQFAAATCAACPLREHCTTSAKGRSVALHFHEDLLQQARRRQQQPDFQALYRQRCKVERKIAELMWRHGLRQARYFGLAKVELQAVWTAVVVNLKKLGKAIRAGIAQWAATTPLPHAA